MTRKYFIFCIATILLSFAKADAQESFNDKAHKYVDQYASLAMYEQRKNGIPAAITLGQGILETEAGTSELMTEANNHFGIKCKNGWQGETFTHTDDAPDECFKKYKSTAESYKDHSDHLKRNPRYAPLFKLKETDYKSWAVCLKKCGYATNPQYAQRLIKIIEDYNLQQYTFTAFDSTAVANTMVVPVVSQVPPAGNEMKPETAIPVPVAQKPLMAAAMKTRGDSAQVTVINNRHKVKEGETIASIAQAEQVEVKKLMELNLLNPNEEPLPGVMLELRTQAVQKPAVKVNAITAHTGNAIVSGDDKGQQQSGDYVTIDKTKTQSAQDSSKRKTPPAGFPATSAVPAKAEPKIIIISDSKRPVRPPDPKTDEELAADKKEKEFADLKAELDKIVYADDSKLITQNAPQPTPEKKIAVQSPAARESKTYVVKKGDTAFSIAKRNNITVAQLMKWNNMEAGDVKVGQALQVKE